MFRDMVQRMILEVPGMSSPYAKTLINEALGTIYDTQMWSWQLKESNWLTPGLQFPVGGNSVGTVTFTPYSNLVVGDAVASAAWQAYITAATQPFFTQYQIRSPFYSLYNIIAVDTTSHAPFTTLTLDRPWGEPGGVGQTYMIYQAYFAAPVQDFKRFLAARDTTNDYPMNYWSKSQLDLASEDPQRVVFDDPAYIVPYETDQRINSSTLGFMLYELWPHPLSVLPYSFNYLRRGPFLVNPTDTVVTPLTEDAVLWKAKEAGFLWKEAQKGDDMERGSGANWQFLAEAAHAKYEARMKPVRDRDRDLVDLYFTKYRRDYFNQGEPYATINSQLNVGSF